jgi:tRNA A37 threonylcarbamoyltransferase TsaD
MVKTMADERCAGFYVPEKSLLGDNGAMIAWLGLVMHKAGVKQKIEDTSVNQRFRTDEVNVTWR